MGDSVGVGEGKEERKEERKERDFGGPDMSYRSAIWAVILEYARSPPSTSRASISHRGRDRWLLANDGDQRQEHSDLLLRSLSPTERYLPDGVFRSGGH